ncbi:MoxR-like ATPase [Caldisphaera lagunensis DSM 15908]|uniref:MoxR-like ATPase n=1 Tax=Caldisphaera lagunensis (strain DSM 15908 / JCM 11604 / ANMR 0165 / IC-154) TaxID=1056495 RepID=L0AB67_CALLD|nr:MoxR family ATPase [Caldisphaera lagunensis]AFZ70659.1 MoxR-like ATPase [Caldisphaera lagunensis DSM 15908]
MKPEGAAKIKNEIINTIGKYYVGGKEVIEIMLENLISGGHILLEGYQGLGKTTIAKLFSQAIGVEFKRIQMVSDLLPSDIIGTSIWDPEKKEFKIREGPIFSNIVLIDEFNRAPPRTQSALLEAMQEKQVTIDLNTIKLPDPFLVIATQVPYDTGGIFPLTITQIDRFSSKIVISLPSRDEEIEILRRVDILDTPSIKPIINKDLIFDMRESIKNVKISDEILGYILDIINEVRKFGNLSVRSSLWVLKLSRVNAFLDGRDYVIPDDVKKVSYHVLRHRISSESANPDNIIENALRNVKVPKI